MHTRAAMYFILQLSLEQRDKIVTSYSLGLMYFKPLFSFKISSPF